MHRKLSQKKKCKVPLFTRVRSNLIRYRFYCITVACLFLFVFFSLISFLQFLCTFYLVQLDFVDFSFSCLALKVTKVRLTAFSLSNIPSGIFFYFCISSWSRCVTCAVVIFQSDSIVVFKKLLFCYILYPSLFYLLLLAEFLGDK